MARRDNWLRGLEGNHGNSSSTESSLSSEDIHFVQFGRAELGDCKNKTFSRGSAAGFEKKVVTSKTNMAPKPDKIKQGNNFKDSDNYCKPVSNLFGKEKQFTTSNSATISSFCKTGLQLKSLPINNSLSRSTWNKRPQNYTKEPPYLNNSLNTQSFPTSRPLKSSDQSNAQRTRSFNQSDAENLIRELKARSEQFIRTLEASQPLMSEIKNSNSQKAEESNMKKRSQSNITVSQKATKTFVAPKPSTHPRTSSLPVSANERGEFVKPVEYIRNIPKTELQTAVNKVRNNSPSYISLTGQTKRRNLANSIYSDRVKNTSAGSMNLSQNAKNATSNELYSHEKRRAAAHISLSQPGINTNSSHDSVTPSIGVPSLYQFGPNSYETKRGRIFASKSIPSLSQARRNARLARERGQDTKDDSFALTGRNQNQFNSGIPAKSGISTSQRGEFTHLQEPITRTIRNNLNKPQTKPKDRIRNKTSNTSAYIRSISTGAGSSISGSGRYTTRSKRQLETLQQQNKNKETQVTKHSYNINQKRTAEGQNNVDKNKLQLETSELDLKPKTAAYNNKVLLSSTSNKIKSLSAIPTSVSKHSKYIGDKNPLPINQLNTSRSMTSLQEANTQIEASIVPQRIRSNSGESRRNSRIPLVIPKPRKQDSISKISKMFNNEKNTNELNSGQQYFSLEQLSDFRENQASSTMKKVLSNSDSYLINKNLNVNEEVPELLRSASTTNNLDEQKLKFEQQNKVTSYLKNQSYQAKAKSLAIVHSGKGKLNATGNALLDSKTSGNIEAESVYSEEESSEVDGINEDLKHAEQVDCPVVSLEQHAATIELVHDNVDQWLVQ